MLQYKKITKIAVAALAIGVMSGCTKLNEKLNSSFTNGDVTSSFGAAAPSLYWAQLMRI